MKYKVASIILAIISIVGAGTMIYAKTNNLFFAGPVAYGLIFIIVPSISAFGIWNKKYWGTILSLIFFAPQCINYIGESSSFQFMAPISLGITSGTPGEGTFYIYNLFAIGMVVFIIVLLKDLRNVTSNKALSADA
jgi:hypothetical protein